jgi:hypothetical protein
MPGHQSGELNRNTKVANKSFGKLAKVKYIGTFTSKSVVPLQGSPEQIKLREYCLCLSSDILSSCPFKTKNKVCKIVILHLVLY